MPMPTRKPSSRRRPSSIATVGYRTSPSSPDGGCAAVSGFSERARQETRGSTDGETVAIVGMVAVPTMRSVVAALVLLFAMPVLFAVAVRLSASGEIVALRQAARTADIENASYREATADLTGQITALQETINETRAKVWALQDSSFQKEAILDVDGTIAGTTGECKGGMDIAYNGIWGYAPLIVTLANTNEVLYLVNRPGSRPSSDGAAEWLDLAIERVAPVFKKLWLRGDTDFSLTHNFDRWDDRPAAGTKSSGATGSQ